MKVLGFGGFAGWYYWSSTEASYFNAWDQIFTIGTQRSYGKNDPNFLRLCALAVKNGARYTLFMVNDF